MKDNNPKNNSNQFIFNDVSGDLEYNNNIFPKNNKKDDSLEKYFKQMDDNHETDDILKQLEYLNLSEEKSFDMPQRMIEPLAENNKENMKNNTSSKKKSIQKKKN